MKQWLKRVSLVLCCMVPFIPFASAQTTPTSRIVTGSTGGVYYPVGKVLMDIYNKAGLGTQFVAEESKGSLDNIIQLHEGKAVLGMAQGDTLTDAWNGTNDGLTNQKQFRLRVLARLHDDYVYIVVRPDANIKTLADLKGKRVSIGADKSGTLIMANRILTGAGLNISDLGAIETLGFNESAEKLKKGEIDAFFQNSGLGAKSIADLAATTPIALIGVPDDVVGVVQWINSAYAAGVIPAGTFQGQTEDVATMTVSNYLVTNSRVSDVLAYQMTKLFFDNLSLVVAAHPAMVTIDPDDSIAQIDVPKHSGARKYYKEQDKLEQAEEEKAKSEVDSSTTPAQ